MQHGEFLGLVQARAHLPDRGDAERATRATLETKLHDSLPEDLRQLVDADSSGHLDS
jgi:uncharacterized protein (DUF2267 family)